MKRLPFLLLLLSTFLLAAPAAAQGTYYLYGGGTFAPDEEIVLETWLYSDQPDTTLTLHRIGNPEAVLQQGGPRDFSDVSGLDLTELRQVPVGRTAGESQQVRIPLGTLDLGLYLAELGPEGFSTATMILVTDLAMVVKADEDTILLYTADLRTGQPYPSRVRISLPAGIHEVGTDENGIARISASLAGQDDYFIAAQAGESMAFSELWWSTWATDRPTVHLAPDRSIYLPGDPVNVAGLARSSRTVTPVAAADVDVVVRDSNWEELYAGSAVTDDFGAFSFEFSLPQNAPLGYYSVEATIAGQTSYASLTVDEYRKPEYEVTAVAAEDNAIQGQAMTFTVSGEYLFGGPLAGATVRYVLMEQEFSRFAWRSEYGFYTDDAWGYGGSVFAEGEAVTDADGNAEITVTLPARNYDYLVTFQASVSDESGREISASDTMSGYRADLVFGLDTGRYAHPLGEPITLDIIARDIAENPVSTTFVVETYHYTWSREDGQLETPGPVYSNSTDAQGNGQVTISLPESGSWRLRVRATDSEGRETDTWTSLWIYGGDAWYWDYDALSVTADKPEYMPGETARFVIQSPVSDGIALVTMEGSELYSYELVPYTGSSFTYEVQVSGTDVPNSFLGVAVIGGNRMYSATTSYRVNPSERFLNLEITPDAETLEPGESGSFSIRVTDNDGNGVPAQLSVALVDDALFLLRPDQVTDIRAYFYGYRSNVVATDLSSQMYFGFTEPASAARAAMDEAVFGQGKDAAAESRLAEELEEARLREDFRDTILWLPAVSTDQDGRATVEATYPDNLTRWRLMVRAATATNQVGQETAAVTTTLPVIARLAIPPFLITGDETRIRLIGQSNLEEAVTATMELSADGLTLQGGSRQLPLEPGGRATTDYTATAEAAGTASITGRVLTSERSDAMQLQLPVLPHGVRREQVHADAGSGNWTFDIPETWVEATQAGSVTITPSFTAAVTPALAWLAGETYGYSESVMSRLLPNILAVRSGMEHLLPEDVRTDLDELISDGLARLQELQHRDGGWGFWRYDVSNPFTTAYVVLGLLEARAAGYATPDWVLDSALDFLEAAGQKDTFQAFSWLDEDSLATANADAKAYIWYSMERAGRAADSLSEVAGNPALSNYGLALSVLAFEAGGDTAAAQVHLDQLLGRMTVRDAVAYWDSGAPRYLWSDDRVETTALGVQALALLRPDDARLDRLVNWILLERRGARWVSTKDTAAVVIAALALEQVRPADTGTSQVSVTLNGTILHDGPVEAAGMTIDLTGLPFAGRNSLSVGADGAYWSAAVDYMAEGTFPEPVSSGLGVTRTFETLTPVYSESTRTVTYERSPLEPTAVGEFVLVSVTLTPQGRYTNAMVNEPVPAGFTVVENDSPFRVSGIASRYGDDYTGWNYWYDGREIHRERVDYLFSFLENELTFTYILQAETPGNFTALPSQARLLYEPDVNGMSKQQRLEVTP